MKYFKSFRGVFHNTRWKFFKETGTYITFRYSHDGGNGGHWFLDGSVNALFEPDSDELSPVGKLYNKL